MSEGEVPRSSVARSASRVSLAVALSRILGLVREQVFAAMFGGGAAAAAFVVAFRIPNLFRDLLAEGALSSAFVKTFSQAQVRSGEAAASRLLSLVLNTLFLGVGAFVVLGVLLAPWVVEGIAPGYDGELAALTASLTRIMFPYLLLVSLAAVAMGALNARGLFGIPALHSAWFNVMSIGGGIACVTLIEPGFVSGFAAALRNGEAFSPGFDSAARAVAGMAVGVVLGGLFQFGWQAFFLGRGGYRHRLVLDFRDQGLRDVLRLMGPSVVGAAAVQINVIVNTVFASGLGERAVTSLGYAFRLMQLPIGVFGVAIATATLPAISRAAAREDRAAYRDTLGSSIRLALFWTVPSAVGLMVLSRPIIALIYERGAFVGDDTIATGAALACYAPGLIGYSVTKLLAPAFVALDDARTPARVAVLSVGLNAALCAALVGPLGHRGLALSTALVATASSAFLFARLRRRIGGFGPSGLLDASLRIALASAVLAVAARFVADALLEALPAHAAGRAVGVLAATAAGLAAYLAAARLLGMSEARGAIASLALRRRSG